MVTFSLPDQERLLASWRLLEAYNYFENNYVQTIFTSSCDSDRSVVLKTKVNPSQRSPD